MSRIGPIAYFAATLACPLAFAETAPPDPLQPGAAAVSEAQDAAGAAKAAGASAPMGAAKPATRHAAPKAARGAVTVTIFNKRSVGLVELDVGPTGGELKKVQGALAFGRKSVIRLQAAKDCLYDIKGKYADEADTEQTSIDLCKEKAINLTDE